MGIKFSGKLDEALLGEGAACFVGRVIAPDSQRHPIARVRQTQLAVWFLFTRQFRRRRFDLHVDFRRYGSVLCGPANFAQRHQLHVDLGVLTQSSIGGVDYAAGKSCPGIP